MKYRRSIFTFLDILGFRELVVGSREQAKMTPEGIGSLLNSLREEAEPSPFAANHLEISFVSFSDCTIRAVPIKSSSTNEPFGNGIFALELMNLVLAQSYLASQGFFLRGAVTIGDIYVDGSTVFGPALVRAHTLESEFAVYPRIVMDPESFGEPDDFLRGARDPEAERKLIRKLLRRDSDGLFFVDYLRAPPETGELPDEMDFFKRHKQSILRNSETQKSPKVVAKYRWLATYHNAVIREIGEKQFSRRGLNINEFLIGKLDSPLVIEF